MIWWEVTMVSRMPTRCYVHIDPHAQLSYWVWDQFPLALCNPPVHDIRLAVLSGLRSIIFSPSLLFSPFLLSLLQLSLLRSISLVVFLSPSRSRSSLLSQPIDSPSFPLFFLSFALARFSRLLSIACQHNAS